MLSLPGRKTELSGVTSKRCLSNMRHSAKKVLHLNQKTTVHHTHKRAGYMVPASNGYRQNVARRVMWPTPRGRVSWYPIYVGSTWKTDQCFFFFFLLIKSILTENEPWPPDRLASMGPFYFRHFTIKTLLKKAKPTKLRSAGETGASVYGRTTFNVATETSIYY